MEIELNNNTRMNMKLSDDNVSDIIELLRSTGLQIEVTRRNTPAPCMIEPEPIVDMEEEQDTQVSTSRSFIVEKVLDHKRVNDVWQFKLRWKGGSASWVDESDCDCEILINDHLNSRKIYTSYAVCRVSSRMQSTNFNVSLDAQEDELLYRIR